jgi:eukaryotic-like serine/threonine-protein kinase
MTARSATGEWRTSGAAPSDFLAVNGYEILEELGRGGMGVVYKARQVNLNRIVALKLIRDDALAGPQDRARFRIESVAAARMQHPNIVQIYDAGEDNGRPYLAMEFVAGGSLDQHLQGEPQPAEQAAALVRTLAIAAQHAHLQNVVHRDLKPANVLLARADSEGGDSSQIATRASPLTTHLPKITDFGLAKRLDSTSVAWTQDGAVLGTASYMAPEQASGQVENIGPAVDIYALGAIFFQLLTGRPPFEADSWNQTIDQVLRDEPTPPTRLNPRVPRNLETVCLKCLEKEPGRRYASAQELADDLGRFLEDQPVVAVPLSDRERLARRAARDEYQLGDEIGRGPRSTVYRAEQGPAIRAIALKVFTHGICSKEEWDTWLTRGAELWSAISHPNIVTIQRAGWWDGAPYVTLEYVPNGSLSATLTGQPFPIHQALRLVELLAEVVVYLHRQGVVHANLKPSNVLLAADGIPRVADFRITGGFGLRPFCIDDHSSAGVSYLAPELLVDPRAEARPYTDIYGLGTILYELLTGRPPFVAPTAQETAEQVRSKDPVPPSRFNSNVSPNLEAFCLRCLNKNPWRRYSRAYTVLSRLRDFQRNS